MENQETIRKEMLEIVERQIKANNPKETKLTYNRLLSEGYSKTDAKVMIAQCLTVEIFEMMKAKEMFNEARYVGYLQNLPNEPFDQNEE